MKGTEKQITWAEDIREKAIPMMREAASQIDAKFGLNTQGKEIMEQVVNEMTLREEAKFWIGLPVNILDLRGIIQSAFLKKVKEATK